MKKSSYNKKVLYFGIVGIVGVFLTIISDFLLIGRPNSAYSFLWLGTESMADISQWRITAGALFGVFVLPFQLAGLIPMYYGIKPSGKVLPFAVLIICAHAITMGVAFHVSYAYIGSGWKLYYEIGIGDKIVEALMNRYEFYWKIIIFIMFAELFSSSAIFAFLILRGKTLYPKWMSIFNPFFVLIILFPIIFSLPHPVGGYIAPAFFNIATLAFFCISTFVVLKRISQREATL